MVQSLPGFLDLCLNVCSPSQVLGDVHTEVLEAAHPVHRGPPDHKRCVGPLLSSREGPAVPDGPPLSKTVSSAFVEQVREIVNEDLRINDCELNMDVESIFKVPVKR